jgi:hypothetical protein
VTWGTTGHNSGDVYQLPLQVSSPVSASGVYVSPPVKDVTLEAERSEGKASTRKRQEPQKGRTHDRDQASCRADTAHRCARAGRAGRPSLSEVWTKRQRISNQERSRFEEVLEEQLPEVLREQQEAKERDPSYPTDQARAQREAISRTLVALDYLSYTRRRIPSPI